MPYASSGYGGIARSEIFLSFSRNQKPKRDDCSAIQSIADLLLPIADFLKRKSQIENRQSLLAHTSIFCLTKGRVICYKEDNRDLWIFDLSGGKPSAAYLEIPGS